MIVVSLAQGLLVLVHGSLMRFPSAEERLLTGMKKACGLRAFSSLALAQCTEGSIWKSLVFKNAISEFPESTF